MATANWSASSDTSQIMDVDYEEDELAYSLSDDDVNKTHTHGGSGNETTTESGIDIQPDEPESNETSETFRKRQDVIQRKTSSHSKGLNIHVMRIFPNYVDKQGGCFFMIDGNQSLPPGKYPIVFGDYGTSEASGNGTRYLEGKEVIPAAKRRGTHSIQIDVLTASREQIGVVPFMYVDTAGKMCLQQVTDSSSTDTSNPPNRQTKRLSNECEENPSQNKRMKSYPIDMSMLMYLCDEMAKRGDKDFFRALIKLGILGDVLTNRSKYFNSFALTAKEHGHSELAELIAMSSRNTSRDCLMENLTLGKLVDAVQRERSLVNSIDSSDDDSDSCISGYNGDYDSEDEKLSSNADSDDDSRSGNILQEVNEEKESANCVITEQGEQVQEEERKLQLELEAKAKDEDVTKRVPSEKNAPMICAQVESSGVETSRSITVKNGVDNMDTQAVKTAVVESTSVPNSIEHSTNLKIVHVCDLPETGTTKSADIQTLYKTDHDLSSNASSDDDESRSHTIAKDLNEGKGSANWGITEQGEQVQDANKKEDYLVDDVNIKQKALTVNQNDDLSSNAGSDDDESRSRSTIAQDLNEEKEPANCVITEQGEQGKDVNEKEDLVDDDIPELKPISERWNILRKRAPVLSCSRFGISLIELMRETKESMRLTEELKTETKEKEIKRQLQLEKERKRQLQLEKERKRQLQLEKEIKRQLQLGRFKSRGGGWKVILKSPRSGCGKSVVDLTRKRKMTFSNSSLSDLNFKDPTIMKQSLAFLRNILVFIDKLHMQEKRHGLHNLTNPLTVSIENRFHELAVIGGMDERTEGPGDEVQSTCAKDVTWIALDLAGIGDEVVATKVEILSEAISENDSEN